MPAPLSVDLRIRIIDDYAQTKSMRKTAERFNVAVSTVSKLHKHLRENNNQIKAHKQGRKKGSGKLANTTELLKEIISFDPDLTIEDMGVAIEGFMGIIATKSTVHRKLEEMEYTYKVMELLPSEQDRRDVKRKRRYYVKHTIPFLEKNINRVVCIDEFGTTTKMTRKRGWGHRKERVRKKVPFGHWQSQTGVVCISIFGSHAMRIFLGPMTSKQFCRWLKNDLFPAIGRGRILLMDNHRCHKTKAVRDLIEEWDSEPCYLPPYSMDFQPAEYSISKIKSHLNKDMPRDVKSIRRVAYRAAKSITSEECIHYFEAAHFTIPSKFLNGKLD